MEVHVEHSNFTLAVFHLNVVVKNAKCQVTGYIGGINECFSFVTVKWEPIGFGILKLLGQNTKFTIITKL
jgi:hypothetical protein